MSWTRHTGPDRGGRTGRWSRIAPLADELPRQAVHLDLTDANVVVSRVPAASAPDGVIDFGDLTDSWAVSELAITASSVLGHPGSDPTSVLPAFARSTTFGRLPRRKRKPCGRCSSCAPRC